MAAKQRDEIGFSRQLAQQIQFSLVAAPQSMWSPSMVKVLKAVSQPCTTLIGRRSFGAFLVLRGWCRPFPMRQPLSAAAKEIRGIIRAGKLFDFQKWIAEGKPVRFDELPVWRSILCTCTETGFHSMVEVALSATKWEPFELAAALELALDRRQLAISWLLIKRDAPIQDVSFYTICSTVDCSLMELFMKAGGDPAKNNGFANGLRRNKHKPLLRFYRVMRGQYPVLDEEAALALRMTIQDRDLRWTSQLVWAGASPWRRVPHDMTNNGSTTAEMTSAAAAAC